MPGFIELADMLEEAAKVIREEVPIVPVWQDRPTRAGMWVAVSRSSGGIDTVKVTDGMLGKDLIEMYRWYGPIPADN